MKLNEFHTKASFETAPELLSTFFFKTIRIQNKRWFWIFKTLGEQNAEKSLPIATMWLLLRACSHEPGTVNYPGVMIAPGQELPRVHMMICCPGAMLPRVNFIAPGQVHRNLITTNSFESLWF